MPTIPESEITIDYARSSGPGGQNVNKRDTKAIVRWNIGTSKAFSEAEKDRIRSLALNRLTTEDDIVLSADDQRSQAQNRESALVRLQELVQKALIPKKKRRTTKPTRASKERRLKDKRIISKKKSNRKSPPSE